MLGARARAAEYNAFKAASARQASREAEEQRLPPKPVPVSLSAFTKNTQPNRNKGAKAYVPLVLEDASEDGKEALGGNNDTPSTPTHQARTVDRDNSAALKVETPLGPRNPQPVRVVMPAMSAPTAPKAMIAVVERTPGLMVPTPQRSQPHSITRQSQQAVPISVQSSPSTVSGTSGFPGLDLLWPYLPALPPLGYPSMRFFQPTQYLGDMMAPSDLSPTKQENKLALLSRSYGNPSQSFGATPQQFSGSPDMRNRSQMLNNSYATATPAWNPYQQFGGFVHDPSQRPVFQHFNSDGIVPPNEEPRRNHPMPTTNLPRRLSYPDTDDSFLNPGPDVDISGKVSTQNIKRKSAGTPEDEPYDRNSKMQNFVAAQQALAKTGKTVLHNPDLHRVKASDLQRPPSTASSTTSEHEFRIGMKEDNVDPGSQPSLRPPPGFEMHAVGLPIADELETYGPSPLDDEALRKEFGVDTDDWYQLKPVSKSERLRMNRVMKLCSTAIDADTPKALFQDMRIDRRDKLLNSFQWESQGNRVVRNVVEQIVEDHIAGRITNNLGCDGAVSHASVDVDMEKAAIYAVGDIWANLLSSTEAGTTGCEQETFPCKYKPAPEYAIERGRLLTGNSGSSSFFEEDTGGFYNAPSRIARDPRFRPTSKEGIKPKSDDEWNHRFDMYGRRRL
ncbi:hypothetical protein A1O3_03350 [Capronia epimyces CBS 606.96]|uniref:Uncharacterized protein n=1 Tax=Capronia epimyces CBS 606.96 TaxID=1182542 RepID=W9YVV0_9EURO|nr:uncharacterized protein A1O3_03350 [Capronia epimyces CBS 606.96]EXJ86399.1 hypothetical protein A1O3_03350 [Capronia epimyces CBS 606.96]